MKNFILSDFTAAAYSIPDHNCNDFTSMALKFLKPTESYVGLNALSKVMMETAQPTVLEQFGISEICFRSEKSPNRIFSLKDITLYVLYHNLYYLPQNEPFQRLSTILSTK